MQSMDRNPGIFYGDPGFSVKLRDRNIVGPILALGTQASGELAHQLIEVW